jgi:hypothetical protein
MRRILMTALATAGIGLATPAFAAATVTTTNGTPLDWQIFGIKSTGNPVFGSSPNNTNVPNVTFDANTATNMDIVNGFAEISDAAPKTPSLYQVIINPDLLFTDMKFAVQLTTSGSFSVFLLGACTDANNPACYTTSLGSFSNTGQQDDQNYLLSGGVFDGVMVQANAGDLLFHVKQMSYTPLNVPEPGTWAMMLLGFGGIGMAMRRRRRGQALMQLA